VIDMTECFVEECSDVGIKKSVDDVAPTSVADDQTEVSKDP